VLVLTAFVYYIFLNKSAIVRFRDTYLFTFIIIINKALIAFLSSKITVRFRDTRTLTFFNIFNNVLIIAFNIKLLINKEYFYKRFFLRNNVNIFF